MDASRPQAQTALRLVVSSGAQPPARDRGLVTPQALRPQLVTNDLPRQQLLETLELVGAARRHAARRIAHKNALAHLTLVALIAVCIGLWSWLAIHVATVDASIHRRTALAAMVCAVLALVLACRRSEGRSAVAAHQLEVCANEIAELRDELRHSGVAGPTIVDDIRERYRAAMRRCTARHGYGDYLAARSSCDTCPETRWRARLLYVADVYPVSVMVAAVPLVACLFA